MSYDRAFEVISISFDKDGKAVLVIKDKESAGLLKDTILKLKGTYIELS